MSNIAKKHLLIISGEMDPVGGYGKGIKWLNKQLIQAGKDTELKLYKGARHEILNKKSDP